MYNKGKILIIDDEINIVDMLSEVLLNEGFDVITTTDQKEGLEIFYKEKPWIVILDIEMPEISGIQILKEIKPSYKTLFSAIMMSGVENDEFLQECYDLGANSFISKPFNLIKILGLVKNVYRNEKYKRELRKYKEDLEIIVKDRTDHLKKEIKAHKLLENKLKATVEETKLAKKEIEEANKAKSYFLANMSHEIRTPLNAIIGFSDLLHITITDEKQKRYLSSITNSGENLLLLINDILDITKIEADKMEIQLNKLDLSDIFNEINNIFSLKIEQKKLKFIIEIDDNIPSEILIDEVRLRQILFNLIGNSLKFTEKGYIRLFARCENLDKEKNIFDIVFGVEDTGIGIDEEYQKKIFNTFYQKESQDIRKYGGTGLGLAITKRLIEMMNGSISLESKVNKGSKFEVILKGIEISSYKLTVNKSTSSIILPNDFVDKYEKTNDNTIEDDFTTHIWEKEIIGLYKKVIKNHFMPDLKDFTNKIFDISRNYDLKELEKYSIELKQHLDFFDFKNVDIYLEKFPEYLLVK